MPPPQYRPLDPTTQEIRLLHLEPAERFNDPVVASLRHENLASDPAPHYETISYVWGDARIKRRMHLDGVIAIFPMSSVKALRRLRLKDKPRVLWIDAVCINQREPDERAQQVSIMADIYHGSQGNLIHLGESSDEELDDIRTALKQVELINADIRTWTKDFTLLKGTMLEVINGVFATATQATMRSLYRSIDYEALQNHLFSCPWFSRLWVLQEACLAPCNTYYLAEFQTDLLDILRCACWISYHYSHTPNGIFNCKGRVNARNMVNLVDKDMHTRRNSQPSLAHLLRLSRNLQVSDPRDRVYGMLGLKFQAQEIPKLLRPDYRKPVSNVFRDATRYALFEPGFREVSYLLEYVLPRTQNELEQPGYVSWVPNLTRPWDRDEDPCALGLNFNCGSVEHHSSLPRRNLDDSVPEVLELRGFELDAVSVVSSTLDSVMYRNLDSLHTWLDEALMLLSESRVSTANLGKGPFSPGLPETTSLVHGFRGMGIASCSRTRRISLHAMSSVLMAGRNNDLQDATDKDRDGLLDMCRFLLARAANSLSLDGTDGVTGSDVVMSEDVKRWGRAFRQACDNRRVFRTAEGFIGVGPQVLQPGDVVTVLYGLRHPYILRPRGDTWQLLGQCYVEGIMYGEAVKKHEERGEADTWFRIR